MVAVAPVACVVAVLRSLPEWSVDFPSWEKTCFSADDPLIRAASVGDQDLVEQLIAGGHDVDTVEGSASPLQCAAKGDHLVELRMLLGAGADPDVFPAHERPLEAAIRSRHVESATALITAGADLQVSASHDPYVVIAAQGGDAEIIELLLTAGADPNGHLEGGQTPLGAAAAEGHAGAVEVLLAHGADPEQISVDNLMELTPLVTASYGGHTEVVKALLAAGADANKTVEMERWLFEMVACFRSSDASRAGTTTPPDDASTIGCAGQVIAVAGDDSSDGLADEFADTAAVGPLLAAASGGHAEAASLLLWAGADPNATSFEAYTPLLAATFFGDADTVRVLLDGGADPNLPLPQSNVTPLTLAQADGNQDIVDLLTP